MYTFLSSVLQQGIFAVVYLRGSFHLRVSISGVSYYCLFFDSARGEGEGEEILLV